MIVGLNRTAEHEGRQLHVQVEDLGEAHSCFEIRVHDGGAIVWSKRVDYSEIRGRGLPRNEQDEAVRASMEKALHTAMAAIARGRLP
jgi:hypothetical protein